MTPTLARNDVVCALLSGILLFLVYPPFNFTPLLIIALIPVFLRLESARKRANAELGFLTGVVFYLGLLQWLHHVTTGGMLALVVYLSMILAITFYLLGWAKRFSFGIPLCALMWAGVEYLRSLGALSFAWGYMGHGLYPLEAMKQIVYWIGVPGLSFLIVGLNASLAAEVEFYFPQFARNERSVAPRTLFNHIAVAGFVLALLGCELYGRAIVHRSDKAPHTKDIRVALIQGNFEQEAKESASEKETADIYLDLSTRALADKPDLIVWPESTISMPLEYCAPEIDRIQSFVDGANVELLIGAVSAKYSTTDKWRYWNTAFLFSPGTTFNYDRDPVDLSALPSYSKMHLVPFGEWIPLGQYWPINYIETLIEEAGAGIFEPGDSLTLFHSRTGIRFAVTICFESTLPWLWREAKNQGADFIVNLTNDAWYKRSTGLEQHFSQCVFRAAENRLPVVRVANTGITGVLGPTGRSMGTLPPYHPEYKVFSIPLTD